MPDRDDRSYFLSRARLERVIGSACEDNAVALAHLKMADEYERRAVDETAQRESARDRNPA
jgi:hypothetical protein